MNRPFATGMLGFVMTKDDATAFLQKMGDCIYNLNYMKWVEGPIAEQAMETLAELVCGTFKTTYVQIDEDSVLVGDYHTCISTDTKNVVFINPINLIPSNKLKDARVNVSPRAKIEYTIVMNH